MSQPRATAARSKTTTARLDLDKKKGGRMCLLEIQKHEGREGAATFK